MLPSKYNIPTAYRGDDWPGIKFKLFDIEDAEIIIDGATALMHVRKAREDEPKLILSTSNNRIEISGNEIWLKPIDGEDMDIEADNYLYDLQVIQIGGEIVTYINGHWAIKDDITYVTGS